MNQMALSKTQVDRLGVRLKNGAHTESDLRLLDEYRIEFGAAYEMVQQSLARRGQSPTGRLAKSTVSIIEKLRRESIRLTQIQDIAGCRVVVADIAEQDALLKSLIAEFPDHTIYDRRSKPSNNYRAVHLVVNVLERPVEIQIRNALQHMWAEVSEKSSDIIDPAIKYGGGPAEWRRFLNNTSDAIWRFDAGEVSFNLNESALSELKSTNPTFKEAILKLETAESLRAYPIEPLAANEEVIDSIEFIWNGYRESRKRRAENRAEIENALRHAIAFLSDAKGKEL